MFETSSRVIVALSVSEHFSYLYFMPEIQCLVKNPGNHAYSSTVHSTVTRHDFFKHNLHLEPS